MQFPILSAFHSASPSLLSEIDINPSFWSSVQLLAQAQNWGLTEALSCPWVEAPKDCGCSGVELIPMCESLGHECGQTVETRLLRPH